ncbi:MAG TPA: dihydrolipoamide acetyltransferase family protein [Actinomycetota bacterium]|nr:dihydrolipoamide acetyltransferase family protein [Actinomycetota bacterium]
MPERTFDLPDLGEGLEDAELVAWKVSEGDQVELNQPLVEVNTAKALVEIPSPFAGTVTRLHGAEGDVIKVGTPLVTFEVAEGTPTTGEAAAAAAAGETAREVREDGEAKREAVLVGYGVDQEGGKQRRRKLRPPGPRQAPAAAAEAAPPAEKGVRATPPVRKLARERGVDLSTIRGTGPGGRITREDVLGAGVTAGQAPAAEVPRGEDVRVPVRGVRRMIAEKMARSWAEIPHVTTFHTVDATWVEALRRELTEESGRKVSALAVVVRALVEILGPHPKLNSTYDTDAGEHVLRGEYHVGIATDTERGLMVPVVRDVDRKGIVTLAREIAEVVGAARDGKATPDQLTGSTITVSNVGTFGSAYGTPIINFPEAAILALGTIEPRALVVDGRVEARPAVTLSLSFDHRIIDGADADRAMRDLRAFLESPFRLGALPRD